MTNIKKAPQNAGLFFETFKDLNQIRILRSDPC